MTSIDHDELFEQYYQKKYDFNTSSLTDIEVAEIKKLAREKRVDYALAPLGTGIFDWICDQNNELRIEPVAFESDSIDGMLYIPTTGQERAYIILNSNKPLANQIFAAAHEFYHYVKDYQIIIVKPNVFISTKEAFANILPHQPSESIIDIIKSPIHEWRHYLTNDFEASIFPQHPEIASIKLQLYEKGAEYASMSGSGSSVFGLFAPGNNLPKLQISKDCFTYYGVLA